MSQPERIGPLFTDLYELTMAAGYFANDISADATFSLYVRDTASRNYYVAAGLELALQELARWRFSTEEIAYLRETGLFSEAFLQFLAQLRFSGSIHAMPEATIFFPDEPVLEVSAPIIQAQLVETFLLNTIGFATLIATKAARCVHAAGGRPLIDFALRRTQARDAGLQAARDTYLAGFAGTSNVLAGKLYGIPVAGTMAHSYIEAFDHEVDAFRAYGRLFPDSSVFLIDTYDTMEGARRAARVGREMAAEGHRLQAVRLDSGDMIELSRKVRQVLDEAGLPEVRIFASSGFDEFKVSDVIAGGACIDAFGVGTKVGTAADEPYLDIVYKLVHFGGRGVRKYSPGKQTLAGAKQVFRFRTQEGTYRRDIIGVRDEALPGGEPLLEQVLDRGRLTRPLPELDEIRRRFQRNFALLDERYKNIRAKVAYPVDFSPRLLKLQPDK